LGQSGFDRVAIALAHDEGNPGNLGTSQQGNKGMDKKGTARQSHEGFA